MTRDLNTRLQRLEATTKSKDRTAYDNNQAWRLAREWYGEPIALSLYDADQSPFMLLTRDEIELLLAYEDSQAELAKHLEAINDRPKAQWQERYERYKNTANAVGLT